MSIYSSSEHTPDPASQLPFQVNSQRLYADLAYLWPVISPVEDYASEAAQFIDQILAHTRIPNRDPSRPTLLDLGCGGGHNDYYFKRCFTVTGVDLSAEMLALARRLNPEIYYLAGDMRTLRMEQKFDAVVIADSIFYMLKEEDLRAAFITAYQHLKPGGIFCTYAEETLDTFQQNGTYVDSERQSANGELQVVLVENQYDPDPTDTSYESLFIYLVRQNGQLSIQTDHHVGGLFPLATWLRLLEQVGFEVHVTAFEDEDFPFFTCVKPSR